MVRMEKDSGRIFMGEKRKQEVRDLYLATNRQMPPSSNASGAQLTGFGGLPAPHSCDQSLNATHPESHIYPRIIPSMKYFIL